MPDQVAPAPGTLPHMAQTPILQQIRRLFKQRQAEGWTIPKLAKAAGVGRSSAYRVIEQDRDCTTEIAYRLYQTLKDPPPLPIDRRRKK